MYNRYVHPKMFKNVFPILKKHKNNIQSLKVYNKLFFFDKKGIRNNSIVPKNITGPDQSGPVRSGSGLLARKKWGPVRVRTWR